MPLEVEILAAAHALEFGWEIGIGEAVLEGDSELTISTLKEHGHSIAAVDPLIQGRSQSFELTEATLLLALCSGFDL